MPKIDMKTLIGWFAAGAATACAALFSVISQAAAPGITGGGSGSATFNLSAAEGHPAAVMDMSFANQALSAEYVAKRHAELTPQVYVVPEAIDGEVARLKLAAMGITLDAMTAEQLEYISSWQHGT